MVGVYIEVGFSGTLWSDGSASARQRDPVVGQRSCVAAGLDVTVIATLDGLVRVLNDLL